MKFHVEKIYLWFSPEDKRCITFENNKVNVIRGNSSRGKSNLFAIIDYCLMSDKPNIVEPIINECTEAYGLEFVLNDTFYAVSRKKPEAGTASQWVWVQNEPFKEDYYPIESNTKPFDFRRQLDIKSGLKEDYLFPLGYDNGKPVLVVSFRSFLMFNALTENIISSQYEFLNYKFFEEEYVDSREKRAYLMDVLLGIDNVEEGKQKRILSELNTARNSSKRQKNKYKKAHQKYDKYRSEVIELLGEINKTTTVDLESLRGVELVEYIEETIQKYTPHKDADIAKNSSKISELSTELYKKKMLLFNINRAIMEYQNYLKEMSTIEESLKPVEYLCHHLPKNGVTIWGRYILEELKTSLLKLKPRNETPNVASIVTSKNIENLEKEISECENHLKELSEIKLKPIEESSVYLALGQLKTLMPMVGEAYNQIPQSVPKDYDYVNDRQLRTKCNSILEEIEKRRRSIVRGEFDNSIQKVYDSLRVNENFENCKTRYNRDHERLELSDGNSILTYNNIGSQSNYMYLHICFFLGLHNFLLDNPCEQVGNFLFIDQPSVPYYENSDNDKSNDKTKLLDVFRVINEFVEERLSKGNEFQIILIEHAEEAYWTGANLLSCFSTRANFDGDEALVPLNVIKKHRNESKNQ